MADRTIIPVNLLPRCATALTAAALAACEFTAAPMVMATPIGESAEPVTKTLVYECPEGYRFTARISADRAQLLLPHTTLTLPQVRSGSGARYSENGVTFWSKGEAALLETTTTTYRECRINRPRSIWEDARLRGVDVRGVGNEPGWQVEITNGANTLLVLDYGEQRYLFATPSPVTDRQANTITYATEAHGHDIVIQIAASACRDTLAATGEPRLATQRAGRPR